MLFVLILFKLNKEFFSQTLTPSKISINIANKPLALIEFLLSIHALLFCS